MKVVLAQRYGHPEVLSTVEQVEPVAGEGQVVVRVAAAGVNFADILMRLGLYPGGPKPPFVPGFEVAGTVDSVGPGVSEPAAGDRVVAFTFPGGGYAEKVAVPANRAMKIPEQMSFEDAAALPVNYLTAYQALYYAANLHEGERVLIHAAAGGVGLAALQLARLRNAQVFGTASGLKHSFLREQGVAYAVDYTTTDFEREIKDVTAGEGVDVVLDAVGGPSYRKSFRLLRQGGRLVCFGMSAAVTSRHRTLKAVKAWWRTSSFNPLDMIPQNRAVIGLHLGQIGRANPRLVRSWMADLFRLYAEGKIKPYIGKTFFLASANLAHHYIHDRRNLGKVLLLPLVAGK